MASRDFRRLHGCTSQGDLYQPRCVGARSSQAVPQSYLPSRRWRSCGVLQAARKLGFTRRSAQRSKTLRAPHQLQHLQARTSPSSARRKHTSSHTLYASIYFVFNFYGFKFINNKLDRNMQSHGTCFAHWSTAGCKVRLLNNHPLWLMCCHATSSVTENRSYLLSSMLQRRRE